MKFNSTEQSIIWFRDRYREGELELRPPFQRLPVWSEKQKHYLVESVLLQLPIPEIYVQHHVATDRKSKEDKSMYAVVDGQQRIRAVLQFLGVDTDADEVQFNKFALDRLPPESPFHGGTYSGLSKDQKRAFLEYKLAVRQLDTGDEDAVKDLFKRLNKYSSKLNDQELRNATYSGPFMKLSVELADDEYWVENKIVRPAQIRRMKDVEFVSELIIGVMHGPQGGSGKSIDEYYAQYEEYDDEFPGQPKVRERFDQMLDVVRRLLGSGEWLRFQSNRADFYSLFVALASLLRRGGFSKSRMDSARAALREFEIAVDRGLSSATVKLPAQVRKYIRAIEKAVNDKKRRADRHAVLVDLLTPFVIPT